MRILLDECVPWPIRIQASAMLVQNAINVIRPAEFVKLEILPF